MKELPTYTPDFEEYIRQGEPDKKERAQIWRTAIGLQQVDGLDTSEYLREVARKHIEGDITLKDVKSLLDSYYKTEDARNHEDAEDKFRNLLLGENHSLLNREMHLDWKGTLDKDQSAVQSANDIENPLSKCRNCTLEEAAVLLLVQKNPSITQKQIAQQIGKSERTVKTITVNLVQKGILIRRNGKRNGHWELLRCCAR